MDDIKLINSGAYNEMISQTEKKTPDIHIGVNLLKVAMCFEVVWVHCSCWGHQSVATVPLNTIAVMAVPVFMLISFALVGKIYIDARMDKFSRRMSRLAIPLIAWGIIYFLVYTLWDFITGDEIPYGFDDLLWQMLTGHCVQLNPSMWFQFDIIVLTALLFCCHRLTRKIVPVYVIAALPVVLGLLMQYTGWNYSLFGGMRFELAAPLGRLSEMLPYAGIGVILACTLPVRSPDIALSLNIRHPRWLIFVVGLLFAGVAKLPWPTEEGFLYGGMTIMAKALALYCFFNCLDSSKFPELARRWINFLSSYALGIYCIHRLVCRFLLGVFNFLNIPMVSDLVFVSMIFIVSLFLCFLISRLPFAFSKQIVS